MADQGIPVHNPLKSIKHYFLTRLSIASQKQLQHLVSPGCENQQES